MNFKAGSFDKKSTMYDLELEDCDSQIYPLLAVRVNECANT
jgi:hypothetical protein